MRQQNYVKVWRRFMAKYKKPKKPNKNSDSDELSMLYKASLDDTKSDDPAGVPNISPEIDELILKAAKNAVKEPPPKVSFLRRRWEIPVSFVASLMFAILIVLNSDSEVPTTVLDENLPQSTLSAESVQSDSVILKESDNVSELSAAQIPLPEEEARFETKANSPARSAAQFSDKSVAKKQVLRKFKEEQSGLALERERSADKISPENSTDPKLNESERLLRIEQLLKNGSLTQANNQLEEFKQSFPDFDLNPFCSKYPELSTCL